MGRLDIEKEKIEEALKKGIEILKDGEFVAAPGMVSLFWHPSLMRFAFAYGTSGSDAGMALIEDQGKLWRIKE